MSNRKSERGREDARIDMTPMIDVVFQLIIFFIVTINLDQQSVLEEITLPDAKYGQEEDKDPRQITIQVNKQGYYYIGTARYNLRELNLVLRNTVKNFGANNMPIVIRGDKNARHRNVRKVMDICAALGLYRLKFAGMQQAAQTPKVPRGP